VEPPRAEPEAVGVGVGEGQGLFGAFSVKRRRFSFFWN